MLFKENTKLLYKFAFLLFILSALYGLILRWNFTFPLSFVNYQHFLQSHSHVAFLGWGYLATIGVLLNYFVKATAKQKRIYKITLLIIVITITLMLISFPLGGYKLFSVVLLSVFGLASYVLSYRLLKDIKEKSIATKFIKFGVYYYIISSLATWFLAFVLVTQGKGNLYYNTVYFYLHFLYNGYFVFVLFGILFKIFELQKVIISKKLQENFFLYLNVACIPAYALSILWSEVSTVYYIIGFAASMLQLFSLYFLLKIIRKVLKQLSWSFISKFLLKFGLIAYSLKILIQIASAFPAIVSKSIALKPFFIIGYLHLFTLGFMSVILLLILVKLNKFSIKGFTSKIGLLIFLIGIFTTEILLFTQGFIFMNGFTPIKNYNLLVLIFSAFMVVGLLLLFINQFKKQNTIN